MASVSYHRFQFAKGKIKTLAETKSGILEPGDRGVNERSHAGACCENSLLFRDTSRLQCCCQCIGQRGHFRQLTFLKRGSVGDDFVPGRGKWPIVFNHGMDRPKRSIQCVDWTEIVGRVSYRSSQGFS